MRNQKFIFKAPEAISGRDKLRKSVFLAGTIDMGNSEDWQAKVTKILTNAFNVFNPRRDDWDSSWEQGYEKPHFYQQVTWELNALDKADYIILYFAPESKSPISLLELGLYASSGKLFVCCPDGFYRKGNVEVVCEKYGITMYESVEEIAKRLDVYSDPRNEAECFEVNKDAEIFITKRVSEQSKNQKLI